MAIDPSIALGFRPPEPPSQINALAQAMQLQNLQRQNQLGDMQMQQARQDMAEAERFRNALAGDQKAPEFQTNLYAASPTRAQAFFKNQADIKDKESQSREREAKIATEAITQQNKVADQFKMMWGQVQSPEQAAQINAAAYSHPVLGPALKAMGATPEGAAASLQRAAQNPQTWAQYLQSQILGADEFIKRNTLTLEQAMNQGRENANAIMTPDGKGGFVANQPLIDAKKQVARAGASSVSVNMGQKGYENESKLRNDFKSEPIYKDFADMKTAHAQIKTAIAQGTPIADTAAATKIMKLLDPGSVVRESELGIAMAAAGKLDRLQNYVQMQISGNKLTPQQRKDFGALADELMGAATQAYNSKRSEYAKFGERYGLDANVLGQEAPAVTPTKPKADAGGLSEAERAELEQLRKRFKK